MNTPSKAPEINERVGDGRFELLAKLGEGGMSVVYRAHDHLLQSEVALKLLQPRYVGRPEREQRLINEGRYLRRLQGQPRIVKFIDDGRLNDFGWPWLATEVLEGKTLNWQFVAGKVSPDAVLRIAYQVAESLLACHRQGIVNRDPTPTNVFVVSEDPYEIRLFDFSHAAELGGPPLEAGMPGRLTGVFDAPGTVGYMSPEQARKAVPDASMDVFGFGALLYELATKQRPYAQFTNRELFLQAQRADELEPLRVQAWIFSLPEDIGKLVHECTQRDPAARPTMESIVERLEKLGATVPESEEPTERAPKLAERDGDVTAQLDVATIAKLRSQKAEDDSTAEDETHHLDALAERREAKATPTHVDPDHTEQMDAAAAIGRARHAPPSADVIGSWTRPPAVMPVATTSGHLAVATAPALHEPAAEVGDRTDVLAFARPPQLREAAASSVVVAGPSEPQQLDSDAPGGSDPDDASAPPTSEPVDKEAPPPLGPSRGRLVALVAGLGLVLILSWVAYSKPFGTEGNPEKKVEGDRDQSSASVHDPDGVAESEGPAPEAETGAADSEPMAETGGMEIVPEVEPVEVEPPPNPKQGKPQNRKPKNGKPHNGKPANGKDPAGESGSHESESPDPECAGIEDKVQAAQKKRDWEAVLTQAKRTKCWSSGRDRKRLEVSAYLNLARWSECVKAGDGSNDEMVKTLVASCKKNL